MTTVRIARVVKYKGVVYPANVNIPVDDTDVQDLLKRGGWVIKKEAPAKQPAGSEEDDAKGAAVGTAGTENTDSGTAGADADSDKDDGAGASGDAKEDELDELREYAEALGIEVKKNWGIAKLKKEISAAETN
jgi:hypothetical protein